MAPVSGRMSGKMIALCSAAVGAIYAAGYLVTLPAATETGTAAVTAPRPVGPGQQSPLQKAASGSTTPATSVRYRDGTYVGTGSNRIGSVQVAVTIKNGAISDVRITKSTTHYSQSYIAKLPQQVVARQSAQVDVVSGATRSTQAFQAAVQQALAQAKG